MSLPLLAIADLIGVPEADREKLFHWTNSIMNTDDPDFETDHAAANAELMGYAYTMAEERRRCPADDIVTRLVAGRHRRRVASTTSSSRSSSSCSPSPATRPPATR